MSFSFNERFALRCFFWKWPAIKLIKYIYTIAYFKTTPMFPLQRKSRQKVAIPKFVKHFFGDQHLMKVGGLACSKLSPPSYHSYPPGKKAYSPPRHFSRCVLRWDMLLFWRVSPWNNCNRIKLNFWTHHFFVWKESRLNTMKRFIHKSWLFFQNKNRTSPKKNIHEKKKPPNDLYDVGVFDMLSLRPLTMSKWDPPEEKW